MLANQVSEFYQCVYEQEVCMKVFDPAEDIKDANTTAMALTIAGAMTLFTGIVLVLGTVRACRLGACRES